MLGIDKVGPPGRVRSLPPTTLRDTQATPETFNSLELESSLLLEVDFWAPLVPLVHHVFKPVFDQACTEHKGRINFVAFNTDLDESVWTTYGLSGIPAQIMFNDGNAGARNNGAASRKRFRGWLNDRPRETPKEVFSFIFL